LNRGHSRLDDETTQHHSNDRRQVGDLNRGRRRFEGDRPDTKHGSTRECSERKSRTATPPWRKVAGQAQDESISHPAQSSSTFEGDRRAFPHPSSESRRDIRLDSFNGFAAPPRSDAKDDIDPLEALDFPEPDWDRYWMPPTAFISRYHSDFIDHSYYSNVREKSDWGELCHDPAFAVVNTNCPIVPFEKLQDRIGAVEENRYSTAADFEESNVYKQQTPELAPNQLSMEQEARLAALGVTGLARPIGQNALLIMSDPVKIPPWKRNHDSQFSRYFPGPGKHHYDRRPVSFQQYPPLGFQEAWQEGSYNPPSFAPENPRKRPGAHEFFDERQQKHRHL
jgi:hypothetical protein